MVRPRAPQADFQGHPADRNNTKDTKGQKRTERDNIFPLFYFRGREKLAGRRCRNSAWQAQGMTGSDQQRAVQAKQMTSLSFAKPEIAVIKTLRLFL
jgi:hypothetical protein